MNSTAERYGVSLDCQQYDEAFDELLAKLSRINEVVVLVDEYDKPIVDNIENRKLAVELHEILKGFYTVIKACDEYIRFVLLTGISKFSKAGVFSFQRTEQPARYFHGCALLVTSWNYPP